jgi:uncharacterized membrane protein
MLSLMVLFVDENSYTYMLCCAVGAILGAITGALIGLATESGLVRGAGIGAISGAVVSMEVVERSMAILPSHGSGIWSVLYVVFTAP